MKKLQHIFLLFLLLASKQAIAQLPAIDSMKIIPENPTENDDVKAIIYATFPSGDCILTNHSLDIQGSDVVLNLHYTVGAATYICHSTDTVSIGMLTAGDYELEANLFSGEVQLLYDTDTILFSIESKLGVTGISDESLISVYPNPFEDKLTITTNTLIETMELFSISGQKTASGNCCGNEPGEIDLSGLEDGIYFLVLTDARGNSYSKKIIKSSVGF